MDQSRNRPSRPRLRTYGNSARVLVFEQNESEDPSGSVSSSKPEMDVQPRSSKHKVESKEAPVRPGKTISKS